MNKWHYPLEVRMGLQEVGAYCTKRESFAREIDMFPAVSELVRNLADHMSLNAQVHLLYELATDSGIPDIVLVGLDEEAIRRRISFGFKPLTDGTSVRVVSALEHGPMSVSHLATIARVSLRHLRANILPRLSDSGWLEPDLNYGLDSRIDLRLVVPSLLKWAVTVELKRSDWRQAQSQARRHLECADRAYIALDVTSSRPAIRWAPELSENGIGLITVDATENRAQFEIHPVDQPNRRDSATRRLLGERAWDLVRQGQTSGGTFPVFGRSIDFLLN